MGFWTAWQFLTVFPAPRNQGVGQTGIGASVAWFPAVGLILGAMLLGLYQLLDLFLPENGLLTMALVLLALVISTGALHLDGLMDTFDGFAVRATPEERLRIMSDSHVGGFGVVAGCCLILLKYVALISLPDGVRPAGLLMMPVLGRWSPAYAISSFPSAKAQGLGQAYKSHLGRVPAIAATAFALIVAAAFFPFWGLAVMAAVGLLTFGLGKLFVLRLGGLTGDTYGAMIELAEVCILITVVIIGEAGKTSWLASYL